MRRGFVGDGRVRASDYIHPEFGFFCPTPRLRRRLRVALACLVVAGVGAAMMTAADHPKIPAPVTPAEDASIAETTPTPALAPLAALVSRLLLTPPPPPTTTKPSSYPP